MAELIERCLVRILAKAKYPAHAEPVGMGFLVAPHRAMTCAHVARFALGVAQAERGSRLWVDFPLIDGAEPAEATVVRDAGPDEPDVLLLSLDSVPENAAVVRVVDLEDIEGHELEAFGVPDGHPNGVWASARSRGLIGGNEVQIEDERSQGVAVQRGFSGSPLVDVELRAVVGMITRTENREHRRTAYALSGAALYDACPDIAAPAQSSPFRSLQPFQPEDAEIFFGRDEIVRQVVDNLDRDRVRVVSGPSGSGKSSLVLAGVVPALTAPDTSIAVFRPATGSTVRHALAGALADLTGPAEPDLAEIDRLAAGLTAERLAGTLAETLARTGLRRLVLVADQVDEALVRDPVATGDLLAALLDTLTAGRAAPERETRVDLLITISSSMLGALLADARFGHTVSESVDYVTAPAGDRLRSVLTDPLKQPGLPVYEQGLVDRVLREVAHEQNPLPLVEFTLTLLWERQRRGVLTHEAYEELGGVAGALGRYAEQVCAPYLHDEDQTRWLCWLFVQLVSPVEPDGTTRRLVPVDDLVPALDLADALTESRLLTVDTRADGVVTVQLAHEALVRHWPKLGQWVAEGRDFRSWQDELDRQAAVWLVHRERARLLRGSALRLAREHFQQHPAELTARQRDFIGTGIRWRRNQRFWWTYLVCLIAILLAVGSWYVIRVNKDKAVQADSAVSDILLNQQKQLATSAPLAAIDRAVRAYRTYDDVNTRSLLQDAANRLRFATGILPGSYRYLATQPIGPAGAGVLLNDPDGRIAVWTLTGPHPTKVELPVNPDNNAVAWLGPNQVVTSTGDTSVVWDAHTARRLRTLPYGGAVLAADFTGRWFMYGDDGNQAVHVADLANPGSAPRVETLPETLSSGQLADPGTDALLGVLTTGDLVVKDGPDVTLLGTDGPRLLTDSDTTRLDLADGPLPLAIDCAVDDGGHPDFTATNAITGARITEYRTQEVADCSASVAAFSPDGRQVAVTFSEMTGYNTYGGPTVSGHARTIPTPPGYTPVSVAVEPSDAERVLLWGMDSMLVLRIPMPESLQSAENNATSVDVAGSVAVLSFADGHLETWNSHTRRHIATTAAGSTIGDSDTVLSPDRTEVAIINSSSDFRVIRVLRLPRLTPAGQVTLPNDGASDSPELILCGNRLTAIAWGETTTTVGQWSFPGLQRLAGPVSLPTSLSAGYDNMLAVPGSSDMLLLAPNQVHRFSITTGREETGAAFGIPDGALGETQLTEAVLDDSGEYLAVPHSAGVEVWDLASHQKIDQLDLGNGVTVKGLHFQDSDTLEIDEANKDGASAVQTVQWRRNHMLGIPVTALFGLHSGSTTTSDIPGDSPRVWLGDVCRAWRGDSTAGPDLPDGTYTGPICPAP